jgi:hypothetical protein
VFVWEGAQAERGPGLKVRAGTSGSRAQQSRGGNTTFQFSSGGWRRHGYAPAKLGGNRIADRGRSPQPARRSARRSCASRLWTAAQILRTKAAASQPGTPHLPITAREGLRSPRGTPTCKQSEHAAYVGVSAKGLSASRQHRHPWHGRGSASYQVRL